MSRMYTGRKTALFFIVFCLTAAGVFPAAAEENVIRKIRIHLTVSEFDESTGKPVLEASSDSSLYEADEIHEADESYESDETYEFGTEGSRYEIELTAEEDYIFDIMEQSDIKITGIRNSCVKAVRKNGGERLILTMIPEGLEEIMGEVGQPEFSGCTVHWTAADHAAAYLVMLYRNSRRVGHTHRTAGTSYDFSPLMTEEGIYECKIFPLSVKDKKGKAAQTARLTVDQTAAEKNRRSIAGESGEAEAVGWIQDESGWRYIQKDGTWPQNNWLFLDGEWYYFDGEGNMVTDSWQKWKGEWYYLGSTGLMEEQEAEGDLLDEVLKPVESETRL